MASNGGGSIHASSLGNRSLRKLINQQPQADGTLETTELVLADLVDASLFFSAENNPPRRIPSYQVQEVKLGPELGAGEFGVVYDIAQFCLPGDCYSCKVKCPLPNNDEKKNEDGNESDGCGVTSTTTMGTKEMPRSILLPLQTASSARNVLNRQSVSFADTKDSNNTLDTAESCTSSKNTLLLRGMSGLEDDGSLSDDQLTQDAADADDNDDDDKKVRNRIASHCCRNGTARYAVKCLRKDFVEDDPATRLEAMLDLACEARFLQRITHSNVVRLRGTIGTPGTPSFSIIMDRLVETLNVRMSHWQAQQQQQQQRWGHGALKLFRRNNNKNSPQQQQRQSLYLERLWVAFDLARAMRYIHRHHLVYRDIKPENIGFNVRGDVQIFDFGLVKELKAKDLVEAPDGYDATGLTGTRRYMPPEVVRCSLYGFRADVFSYAILFWEIFSLKTAFPNYDTRRHFDLVVVKGKRPPRITSSVFPRSLHDLMEESWSEDPAQRPSFAQTCTRLQTEIVQHHEDNDEDKKVGAARVAERSQYLLNRSTHSARNFYLARE